MYHFRIPADEPVFVWYLETDWSICKAELQSWCWEMLLRSCSPSCAPSDVGRASFLTPALVVSCSKYSLPFAWPQPAESQWIYANPSFLREDPACGCEPVFSTLGSDSLSQHLHPLLGRYWQRCWSCESGRDAALLTSFHQRVPQSVVFSAAVLVCPGRIGRRTC